MGTFTYRHADAGRAVILRRRVASAIGGLVLVALSALTAAQAPAPRERRVLVLQSLDRGNLTLDYLTGNIRVDVDSKATEPVTFTQVVVNPSGFGASPQEAIVEFLRSAFADRPRPDLVMTLGGPAATFARKYRPQLFPEAPLLLAGVDRRFIESTPLSDTETAVSVINDFAAVIDDMLQALPGTTTVFVVVSSGDLSRFWRSQLEHDFARFRPRVTFLWSDGMSYPDILKRVASLPPHSAIFHYNFGSDGQGGAYSEERVLADFRAVANAPVFGSQGAQLGHGIMGGRLMASDTVARSSADIVLRILNGEAPGQIRPAPLPAGPPIYDWRELQRWHVPVSRLPAHSVIRYQPPSLLERYKWAIVAGVSTLVAQAALIAALLGSRVRRQRAEQSLRESEERFRVLANAAPVMVWMADVDMRCTDLNLSWVRFTGRTREDQLGEGWRAIIHPADLAGVVATWTRAFERRDSFTTEFRLRRADGEYRWVLSIGVPRVLPDGSFAGYIGSAIDVTDLKAARAALTTLSHRLMEAHEEERTRLARELHDDVVQRMALLAIQLVELQRSLPATADDAIARAADLNDTIVALTEDVQAISHRLHSSKLDLLGLAAAAGSFCREVAAQRGVSVHYEHDRVPADLPDGVALNLFRVLQEALSNAVRHSGAKEYRVTLRAVEHRLMLVVEDRGRGFDVGRARRGQGLGLISMEERLRLLEGELIVESTPGAGTSVRAGVRLQRTA